MKGKDLIKDKDSVKNGNSAWTGEAARLGPSLSIKGELAGEEDLVIEGQFQGKIALKNKNLTVERGGRLEAEIYAENVTVKGWVKGNVYASGKVLVESDGQLTGDIRASRISIAEGAQFKGSIKMS